MVAAPRHTARGIVLKDNHVLLMERWRDGKHYFSIPGGGIEGNESREEAVIREIAEETDVTVNVLRPVMEMRHGDVVHHIYLCEYVRGEPHLPKDSPEAAHMTEANRFKPGWVPVREVADLPLVYWEPLRHHLAAGVLNGFPDKVAIVRAK
jgi:8-oxo-dGTP diphosphatase